jgi:hypothetical protein
MRRRIATGACAVALVALAGCAQEVPPPQPQVVEGPVPAVTGEQVDRVREAVDAAVDAGDGALDAGALQTRLDGAALQLRLARYAVRSQVPEAPEPPPLVGDQLLEAVPAAGEWPRWFLTVDEPVEGAVPQMLVMTQAGPREAYRLATAATLLPGTTLPELAVEDGVALTVPPTDAQGLAMSPVEAVSRYADVLALGGASQWAPTTAADVFRQQVLTEQDAERTAVSEFFAYTTSHVPREGSVWALRTQDGGAIAIGVLDATRTFTPNAPGLRQILPPDLAALAGRGDAPAGASVTTAEVVVLHVPPAGSQEQLQLLAGNRGVVGVQVA